LDVRDILRVFRCSGFARCAALPVILLATLLATPAAAQTYSRLQVLVPGESPAPGTPSGRTGTPRPQTAEFPFSIRVRACDSSWNTVSSVTNVIRILSSDGSATLPAPTQLVAGEAVLTVTFNAGGNFTIFAHDDTDQTIPDAASSQLTSMVLQSLDFSNIPRGQDAGEPFTVTLTARTPSGGQVLSYSGPVQLKELTSFGEGRTSPEFVNLNQGRWTGEVICYRADETNQNRGNVNLYAFLETHPQRNGTSNPFVVDDGPYSRVQIIVPGESPLPGSVSGRIGTPATQFAGQDFNVDVYTTDEWWNPKDRDITIRITSSDNAASTPITTSLNNGHRRVAVRFGTVGTQTLTVADRFNSGITPMTTDGIQVYPNSAHHFRVDTIASPVTAGVPIAVTIRAVDQNNNTITDFNGQAQLTANTGPGSVLPNLITFQAGIWTGPVEFRGAGGAVALTCSDFAAPPHFGTSNPFTVLAGPFAGLQLLVPGETAQGGTHPGQTGTAAGQAAGTPFNLTIRAVDQYWNLVSGVNDRVALASSDAFADMPAETTLVNGQRLLPVRLFRTGNQTIWASDVDNPTAHADTSSAIAVTGGPFAKLLILAPGEEVAPGTQTGRTGQATDQSINYAFTLRVLATDSWWNPVAGVSDVVHLTCTDPLAQLPADTPLVDGEADLVARLATGGFQQLTVSNVTRPAIPGSSTQVRAITSGFHLEAELSQSTARAGEPFTLSVRVTNDAGAVIQEINSFVSIEVQNASTQDPGRGVLLVSTFQLLQGQRVIDETYTFAEPIVLIVRDDAGNQPAVTEPITITPGAPESILLTSNPPWLRGNKHAILSARLVDAYQNGIPSEDMTFSLLAGQGVLAPIDSVTNASGIATADYLSSRQPEVARIRAQSNAISAEIELETALVDPNAAGGTITNYPNPFYPSVGPTTISYKLSDAATVSLKIYSLTGDLVREETFAEGDPGAQAGVNGFVWDGENGDGKVVASGGYVVKIEATGDGETLHVMRRKIGVVR
jgi:hypothetical protein